MPEKNTGTPRKLEIKKYANRRYYDATHSRHLTLEEIRSLIQQGFDLKVIDAKTSADITAQVLTQIILELDTYKVDSLPVPLLVRLIRMNDSLVRDFIEKYFNQALQSFQEYQQQMEEQFRQLHGLPSVIPSVSAWTKAMLEPFNFPMNNRSRGQDESAPAASTSSSIENQELRESIRELQKQLEQLKKDSKATQRARK